MKRRSQVVSDQEVQGGIFRRVGLQWITLLFANAVGMTMWVRLFELPDTPWSVTFEETFYRYIPFFLISVALLPAFIWDINRTTSRFAGPINRLRRALSDAASGRTVEPLQFRSNDFWKQIAGDFNTLLMKQRKDAQA